MNQPQTPGQVVAMDVARAARQLAAHQRPEPIDVPRAGPPPRVPARYHRRLADLEQTSSVTQAQAWLDRVRADRDDALGLLLLGKVGRGKSALAGAIAVEAGAPEHTQFWPVLDLLAECRTEMDHPRERTPVRQRIATRRLLVLDDIGAEKPTDWTVGILTELIAARYDACRLLIATSNLTPQQLTDHLGHRAASRLREMTETIVVDGPDRRAA